MNKDCNLKQKNKDKTTHHFDEACSIWTTAREGRCPIHPKIISLVPESADIAGQHITCTSTFLAVRNCVCSMRGCNVVLENSVTLSVGLLNDTEWDYYKGLNSVPVHWDSHVITDSS